MFPTDTLCIYLILAFHDHCKNLIIDTIEKGVFVNFLVIIGCINRLTMTTTHKSLICCIHSQNLSVIDGMNARFSDQCCHLTAFSTGMLN